MATASKLGSQLVRACNSGTKEEALEILYEIKKERRPTTALEYRHPSTQFTPLLTAVFHSRPEFVELLVQFGADIHALTNVQKQNTPLHVAAFYGHHTVIKVLVAHGADLYRWNADGLLALDLARMKSHTDATRVLLSAVGLHKGSVAYKSSAGLNPWKPCFARLLRVLGGGAPGLTMIELALYAERADVCPFKVVLFDPTTTHLLLSSSSVELTFSAAVATYNYKSALFSRDPALQATKGRVTPSAFTMRTDTDVDAARWIAAVSRLKSSAASRMGPDTYRSLTPPSSSSSSSLLDDVVVVDDPLTSGRSLLSSQASSQPLAPPPPLYVSPPTPMAPPPPAYAPPRSATPPHGPPPSYDEAMELVRRRRSLPTCKRCNRATTNAVEKCAVCLKTEQLDSSMARLGVGTRGSAATPSAPAAAAAPSAPADGHDECVICMDEARNAVCIPCGHLSSCYECVSQESNCPICRAAIQSVVKVYKA
ncbi:Aste57867_3948 [Aphanomyces stellatus]|uniref:Aste57867_3948 protein n=1 Tax=Aphanomyces stellatus TaxID=120398 RepID=A0A485KAN1_9STRA|nr:hypothetical protein As57867_003937 [Aphanomyces stellatus]VFT81085.1 Aste57867_3948 [Aphanomyces stellatus]